MAIDCQKYKKRDKEISLSEQKSEYYKLESSCVHIEVGIT